MTSNHENLRYLVTVIGKPVLVLYNKIEDKITYVIIDTFVPANPGSHIYDNSVTGKIVDNIVGSLQTGFAHNTNAQESFALLTKVEELPQTSFVFPNSPDFTYIKILR